MRIPERWEFVGVRFHDINPRLGKETGAGRTAALPQQRGVMEPSTTLRRAPVAERRLEVFRRQV